MPQGGFEVFPEVPARAFLFVETERRPVGQPFFRALLVGGQGAERFLRPVPLAQPLVTAAQGDGRQPAFKGTPPVGPQASVGAHKGFLRHLRHFVRQNVRRDEALHARPVKPQNVPERFRVAVQHGPQGGFARILHELSSF